ncbi:MAG: hypothetical protein ACRDL0_13245 [Thermoleophilaceae bacterium]
MTRGPYPLALAAVGIVAIVFVAACGGDDSDGSSGFERYEEDGLTVEYPASWIRDEEREGGQAGTQISVHGRRDEDGLFPRLTVARQEKEFANAAQAGGVLAAERPFQLNDGRLVSDGRVEVPGSDGAWRVVTRFELPLDGGGTVPGRAVEVIALKGDEQFILTLAGPARAMEQLPVDRIVGSLELS